MSIMRIEHIGHYLTVVIPDYTAADLNMVIRALHDLREHLNDPGDAKARRTVEMGHAAATELDRSLRFSEHETVAGLIAADEPRDDDTRQGVQERVGALGLAFLQRDELRKPNQNLTITDEVGAMTTTRNGNLLEVGYRRRLAKKHRLLRLAHDLGVDVADLTDNQLATICDNNGRLRPEAVDLEWASAQPWPPEEKETSTS